MRPAELGEPVAEVLRLRVVRGDERAGDRQEDEEGDEGDGGGAGRPAQDRQDDVTRGARALDGGGGERGRRGGHAVRTFGLIQP
jgi:hypothetical protein